MERKVAIVGTGLVGRAWAIAFARGGCRVALYDPEPGQAEAALDLVRGLLGELAAVDLLGGVEPDEVFARLAPAAGLAKALGDASYVQESAPEVIEVKRTLFAELDAAAGPETILASSTSGRPVGAVQLSA